MPSNSGKRLLVIILIFAVIIGSCSSGIKKVGRREGCKAAEEKLAYFAEREIRIRRFKDDMKARLVLAPLSLGLGFLSNYLLEATYIIPALAPGGYTLKGDEIGAIGLKKALTYTKMRGSMLDEIDDRAIARMTFEVAMCYYEDQNWSQASSYMESLQNTRYELYIGQDNILFYLGRCYYMLGLYDSALQSYQTFLKVATRYDFRRGQVTRSIQTIEVINKKGLWGLEKDTPEEPEQ